MKEPFDTLQRDARRKSLKEKGVDTGVIEPVFILIIRNIVMRYNM